MNDTAPDTFPSAVEIRAAFADVGMQLDSLQFPGLLHSMFAGHLLGVTPVEAATKCTSLVGTKEYFQASVWALMTSNQVHFTLALLKSDKFLSVMRRVDLMNFSATSYSDKIKQLAAK